MNEAQLFEFFAGGGDLSTLSDDDVLRLDTLLQKTQSGTAPPTGAGPGGIPLSTAETTPMEFGDIPPKQFLEGLLANMVRLGTIPMGVAGPAGIPLRSGILGAMGMGAGAIDPGEGENRFEGAVHEGATQAALEGGAGMLGKALPWLGTQAAVRMGVPGGVRPGAQTRKMVEAFLRERQRGFGGVVPSGTQSRIGQVARIGDTPPVGSKTTVRRRATGQPPLREELSSSMDTLKQELPERTTKLRDVENRITQEERQRIYDNDELLGVDDADATTRALGASDEKFWAGQETYLRHKQGLHGSAVPFRNTTTYQAPIPAERALPPPPNTLLGDVRSVEEGINFSSPGDPMVNFGELVEMAQKQGKSGAPQFADLGKGKWVRVSDSPAQGAARARSVGLKREAVNTARSQEGGDVVADTYLNLNERLSDAFKIETAADKLRRGLAFAGIRGGLGAGLGSAVGGGTSGYEGGISGGAAGGILGILLGPTNVSRLGNTLGRVAEIAPTAVRATDSQRRRKKPVQVRKP